MIKIRHSVHITTITLSKSQLFINPNTLTGPKTYNNRVKANSIYRVKILPHFVRIILS